MCVCLPRILRVHVLHVANVCEVKNICPKTPSAGPHCCVLIKAHCCLCFTALLPLCMNDHPPPPSLPLSPSLPSPALHTPPSSGNPFCSRERETKERPSQHGSCKRNLPVLHCSSLRDYIQVQRPFVTGQRRGHLHGSFCEGGLGVCCGRGCT